MISAEVFEDIDLLRQSNNEKGFLVPSEKQRLLFLLECLFEDSAADEKIYISPVRNLTEEFIKFPDEDGPVAKSERFANRKAALSFFGKIRGTALDIKLMARKAIHKAR